MKNVLIIIGLCSLSASIFFFYESYDKYNNYENSEVCNIHENVYVGGDAYNYIINSNYFIGFNVLGIGSLILTLICFAIAFVSVQHQTQIEILYKLTQKNFYLNDDMVKVVDEKMIKNTNKKVVSKSENKLNNFILFSLVGLLVIFLVFVFFLVV